MAIAPPVMYLGTAEAALSGCGCSCGGKSVIQLGAQNVDINVKVHLLVIFLAKC